MNTFLLDIRAPELKSVKNQQEKLPAVEPNSESEPADKKPFQQTLDKQRQPVAATKNATQTQTADNSKQATTKAEVDEPQEQEVEPKHQVVADPTNRVPTAPSILDETLLLTAEQINQQESDQAEMDISTLMESTQPSTKPLKTAVDAEQDSDQPNDPNLLLTELSPFATLMKQEGAGALQFHWQDLAKAERGSSHQTMPHQLLGETLVDVKTQLLDGGENSTGLTSLLSPSKLNNQLGLINLQAGIEQRIDFPLVNSATHETLQSHLPQFPSLQLASTSVNANSAQLAQPSVVASQLPLPVPHPNWGQQFSERVVWLVQQGVKTAHIQLDPPDLGMVEVRVQVTQDQASVQFASHHASVRESIEAQLVRLREMFSQQGIDLVNVDVSSQQFAESNRQSGLQANATDDVDEEQDTTTAEVNIDEQGLGLVDYFV
ncbi:flagellar hook-length control protein FliK [Spartinivicinus poritis]|uniref:Flagellar hook-length control protein FliK n=1 Tax=Spartinivicinus poritis TaxID=2994640 RepID=A0ABT5U659_9GAMM|nr:flagellar hook-length control protein FliK [Spartinivicinus sp. A2-2]MDE1461461.1 flagellar hook-length control protein FliK [Spartinivicinus sp. A2-2]